MLPPPCPACGKPATVFHINRTTWAHYCERVKRNLWWDRTSYSPVLKFLVS